MSRNFEETLSNLNHISLFLVKSENTPEEVSCGVNQVWKWSVLKDLMAF